ncbi:MAG: hypothetical protein EAX89_13305 [Candidatus Lokiarchaeota archaeon]|nr:hypothetical protein [Candidatus Lokiarchaeota archaeon]
MTIQLLKLQPIWSRPFKKNVYSCIIANLLGDEAPEVIGCSFNSDMKAFDLDGNELFLTEFSSSITCFKIASVSKENNIELISGSVDGNINVLDIQGNSIWSKYLESPIICMETGDLKDDRREEVLVGLENQKIVGLDNKGDIFLELELEEPIIDCSIGYFSENVKNQIFILLQSGKILNIDSEGKPNLVFQTTSESTTLTLGQFNEQPIMIIGDKNGYIKIVNPNEQIIGDYKLPYKIRCLDYNVISSKQKMNPFLVVASKNKIILLQLIKRDLKDYNGVIIKSISSQPELIEPLEASRESPVITPIESPTPEATSDVDNSGVRVLRGGHIEGGEYIFKIKVINNRKYNITDVNIQILSFPEESLILSRIEDHPDFTPDRAKFHKISKGGGFVSPSFIFKPKHDCIKGTIHSVINFINEEDQIETINVKPHEIRMICGLLKPKTVSLDEFENLTKDVLNFKKVGEEFIIPSNANQLYQKLYILLKNKNFAIIDTEKEEIMGKISGTIKGFAEGSYTNNSVGLTLTVKGNINEQKSTIRVDIFAEDTDMSPSIINEFENAVKPVFCPECEEPIPPELARKLMKGEIIYCEACGSNMMEKIGENE